MVELSRRPPHSPSPPDISELPRRSPRRLLPEISGTWPHLLDTESVPFRGKIVNCLPQNLTETGKRTGGNSGTDSVNMNCVHTKQGWKTAKWSIWKTSEWLRTERPGGESLTPHQLRNSLFSTNPRLTARFFSRTGNFFASDCDPLRWACSQVGWGMCVKKYFSLLDTKGAAKNGWPHRGTSRLVLS